MKFRKKPTVVDAIQFTGDNVQEIWDAFGTAGIYGPTENNSDHLILTTTHGDPAPARIGDWVIPDSRPDTFYPCKPDVFDRAYEPVQESMSDEKPVPDGMVRLTLKVTEASRTVDIDAEEYAEAKAEGEVADYFDSDFSDMDGTCVIVEPDGRRYEPSRQPYGPDGESSEDEAEGGDR